MTSGITEYVYWTDTTSKEGDIILIGRFNGAFCSRYRVDSRIDDLHVVLVPVKAVSVNNGDGTFHTEYVEEARVA